MTMISAARAEALHAIHAERQRQDALHGFNPAQPTGFGRWWARLLDRALHWLYERAKRRGTLTWAHTLVEEVGEVLAAKTPAEAVKELREVAAVCVKVEEALVSSGAVAPPANDMPWVLLRAPGVRFIVAEVGPGMDEETESKLNGGEVVLVERRWLLGADRAHAEHALAAYRRLAESMPRETRTLADWQALLGAASLAVEQGVDPERLAAIADPADMGAMLAKLSRAPPPSGPMQ